MSINIDIPAENAGTHKRFKADVLGDYEFSGKVPELNEDFYKSLLNNFGSGYSEEFCFLRPAIRIFHKPTSISSHRYVNSIKNINSVDCRDLQMETVSKLVQVSCLKELSRFLGIYYRDIYRVPNGNVAFKNTTRLIKEFEDRFLFKERSVFYDKSNKTEVKYLMHVSNEWLEYPLKYSFLLTLTRVGMFYEEDTPLDFLTHAFMSKNLCSNSYMTDYRLLKDTRELSTAAWESAGAYLEKNAWNDLTSHSYSTGHGGTYHFCTGSVD